MRLGHWTLALAVLTCLVLHHGGPWHERAGYLALGVALWRTAWGWVARDPFARWSHCVRGPGATLAYARALRRGDEPHHLGHNPLGAWMILALLSAALAAAASGALYVTDRFWGEAWLSETHEWLGWSLAGLVPLHLAGVVFTSWRQRENLVAAMLHGHKRAPTSLTRTQA